MAFPSTREWKGWKALGSLRPLGPLTWEVVYPSNSKKCVKHTEVINRVHFWFTIEQKHSFLKPFLRPERPDLHQKMSNFIKSIFQRFCFFSFQKSLFKNKPDSNILNQKVTLSVSRCGRKSSLQCLVGRRKKTWSPSEIFVLQLALLGRRRGSWFELLWQASSRYAWRKNEDLQQHWRWKSSIPKRWTLNFNKRCIATKSPRNWLLHSFSTAKIRPLCCVVC